MKVVFVKDGVVLSVCFGTAQFSSTIEGAVRYEVSMAEVVDSGFTLELVDDALVFTEPPPQPTPPEPKRITKLAFRNRFTTSEKVTLEIASLDNPAATMAQRQQAAGLRVVLKDQENANYIDLDNADTRAGVQMLQTVGLIAAGRAAEVLDAPVVEAERYRI